MAGHVGDVGGAAEAWSDEDPSVRSVALGALARLHRLDEATLRAALVDHPTVARRAAELSAGHGGDIDDALLAALEGPDATLVEVAAWALGERHQDSDRAADPLVAALVRVAGDHADALCREAAVAALGAIAHPDALAAILRATTDKTTVRRRAVIALASFDGPEVAAALARALVDRDWQVRQAAEDLTDTDDIDVDVIDGGP